MAPQVTVPTVARAGRAAPRVPAAALAVMPPRGAVAAVGRGRSMRRARAAAGWLVAPAEPVAAAVPAPGVAVAVAVAVGVPAVVVGRAAAA